MKCKVCKKAFKDNELVIPVETFNVTRRGEFVSNVGKEYLHLKHLADTDAQELKSLRNAETHRAQLERDGR